MGGIASAATLIWHVSDTVTVVCISVLITVPVHVTFMWKVQEKKKGYADLAHSAARLTVRLTRQAHNVCLLGFETNLVSVYI